MNSCKAADGCRWLLVVWAVLMVENAFAAPQRLECILTDTDVQSQMEHRSIAILFDDEAATMQWQEGGRTRPLTHVSISMTSMSGDDRGMTIGVSRSSWRVVLQTYQGNAVRTEYGTCAIRAQSPAAAP